MCETPIKDAAHLVNLPQRVLYRLKKDGIIGDPVSDADLRGVAILAQIWGKAWYIRSMMSSLSMASRRKLCLTPDLSGPERYALSCYLNAKQGERILVKDIIGNRVISGRLDMVRTRLKEGDRLSLPLQQAGIFPNLAVQMITVGEESGNLDEMLLRIAETYEKIVKNLIKRVISLIEPIMILLMGVVVGFIVISMLLAIFSMNEMPL